MRFAAGLTVTGILGFLLLEALKIVLVPVSQWIIAMLAGLLAVALKILLVGSVLGAALLMGGVAFWLYRRQSRRSAEN